MLRTRALQKQGSYFSTVIVRDIAEQQYSLEMTTHQK